MKIILLFSNLLLPLTIFIFIIHGWLQKVELFDTFVDGAKEGITIAMKIWPTLVGLLVAIGMLRASGALDSLSTLIQPITSLFYVPGSVVPLILMRPISASGATGILLDLFAKYGPDSYIGRLSSILMGCTETVFYTIAVYFMSVKIKNTRYAVSGALWATFGGVVASIVITLYVFGA